MRAARSDQRASGMRYRKPKSESLERADLPIAHLQGVGARVVAILLEVVRNARETVGRPRAPVRLERDERCPVKIVRRDIGAEVRAVAEDRAVFHEAVAKEAPLSRLHVLSRVDEYAVGGDHAPGDRRSGHVGAVGQEPEHEEAEQHDEHGGLDPATGDEQRALRGRLIGGSHHAPLLHHPGVEGGRRASVSYVSVFSSTSPSRLPLTGRRLHQHATRTSDPSAKQRGACWSRAHLLRGVAIRTQGIRDRAARLEPAVGAPLRDPLDRSRSRPTGWTRDHATDLRAGPEATECSLCASEHAS